MTDQRDSSGNTYQSSNDQPAPHNTYVQVMTPQGYQPGVMAGTVAVPLNPPNNNSDGN